VIRATLDVNVLVSGFPESSGAPGELIAWWLGRRFSLVLSEHILSTLAAVWGRPYWRAHFEQDKVRRAIDLLRARAVFVAPDLTIRGVAVNDEDDMILGTAVAGKVDYLVTGDKPLRALGRYQNVVILSPREFLDILEFDASRL